MRSKLVIVEGPDGAGKTTLIQKLLGRSPQRFRALRKGEGATKADGSCGVAEGWASANTEAPLAYAQAIYSANPKLVAFDRFHISELVYGPLLRGESGISLSEVRILNRVIRSEGIEQIFCLPPFSVTMGNVTREGRERPAFQTEKFLGEAYDRFAGFARVAPNAYVYDFRQDPEGEQFAQRPEPASCPDGVIGSPTAEYLFVDCGSRLPLNLPFFSDKHPLNSAMLWGPRYELENAYAPLMTGDLRTTDFVRIFERMPTLTHVFLVGGTPPDLTVIGQQVSLAPQRLRLEILSNRLLRDQNAFINWWADVAR